MPADTRGIIAQIFCAFVLMLIAYGALFAGAPCALC